jgi:hypothetical protein
MALDKARSGLWILLLLSAVAIGLPAGGAAEPASQPTAPATGQLDAGKNHTCAIVHRGGVGCWGYGREGELGYPNTVEVGATDTPGSVGPVALGPGRTATAISAGLSDTCAILDDGSVRCWGYGGNGRLGYCSEGNVGDTPATLPGKLGVGQPPAGRRRGGLPGREHHIQGACPAEAAPVRCTAASPAWRGSRGPGGAVSAGAVSGATGAPPAA